MAFDSVAVLMPATAATATLTGTGLLVDGLGIEKSQFVRLHVPSVSGTSTPTIAAVIQESAALASGYQTIVTFTDITAAGQYRRRVSSSKKYIRIVLTITGTNPNFGSVQAYFETGSQYDGRESQ